MAFWLNNSSRRQIASPLVFMPKRSENSGKKEKKKNKKKKKEMKTNRGLEGTVSIQTLAWDLATGEFSLEGINFVSQSY